MATRAQRLATRRLQRGLNHFTTKYLSGITPIIVDGDPGKATRSRIRLVKFHLGYRGQANEAVNDAFRSRLWHPKSPRYSSPARIARGMRRRAQQRRKWKANHRAAVRQTGVGRFDGIPVANIAIPYLTWARAHGWQGTLVSGWRDPAYSRSLCYRMCGQPSCPGRCAGTSSNHVGTTVARFAVDVSDYQRFGRVISGCPLRPRIFNALGARDPVHFSPSGN